MKRINDFLNSDPMMVISGVCIAASFITEYIIPLTGGTFRFPIDPAWVSIIISGIPLAYLAIERIVKQLFVSSALLITIAMVAAIMIGEIFAAGEVAFIMAIGGWLEGRTLEKTKKGITALLKLVPTQGRRIVSLPDGSVEEETVDAKDLVMGDVIRVFPGETIAADGKILSGETSVDQSIMTGESLPVDKSKGDLIFAGTINRYGSVDVEVAKSYGDSSLQKMIRLVKDAENNKAPLQKIVDRWATWLVPLALVIAALTYIFTQDIIRAVTVLVVFCPCALALATPTSIVAAIGQATKFGVLIKSGEALEYMGKIKIIAFDKTGTLTHGKLIVSDVLPVDASEQELLSLAASAESRSEHPLGKAIVACARSRGFSVKDSTGFTMAVGKGVSALVDERTIICGNEKLIAAHSSATISGPVAESILALRAHGKAVIIVADKSKILGLLALSDTVKENAANVVRQLKAAGITKTILLTGDNEMTAQ